MKRKELSMFLFVACCFLLMQACEKRDHILGQPSPYITIEDLRYVHKDADIDLTADLLDGAEKTSGVVVSDYRSGNTPEGMIIIQQSQPGKVHGIALYLGSETSAYLPGDSILVDLLGKSLKREGFLYVDGVSVSDIEKLKQDAYQETRNVTASAVYQRPREFESTLVKVSGGEITPKPEVGETLEGVKRLVNGADTLLIHTLATASFAGMDLPRNANVRGLLLGDSNGSMSLWPLSTADIEDVSDPEIPGNLGAMPIVFTGYCADPEGGDSNYEYIQLLANVDIDFSEIPFSVVTTNNAGSNQPNAGQAPGAGWATGGARTLKFNLTEGSVKKGEFFYVGGHQKRISGPNSTSIADLNWARAIAYGTSGGDGLGDASTNILANSGNASGMALFVGTNINEASVPIDVVMFGGLGTATIIDSVNNLGYRVAKNDHYSPFHPEEWTPQPFFSMGTNTYRIPHFLPSNVGFFIQLGGVFNTETREWEEARSYNAHRLTKQSLASELSSGGSVTQQVE